MGERACVEGTVTRLTYARASNGSPTFLDLGDAFTVVVWGEDRARFPDLDRWRGRRVRVTGIVELFRERPRIVLRRPDQVATVP